MPVYSLVNPPAMPTAKASAIADGRRFVSTLPEALIEAGPVFYRTAAFFQT
jgi:hypothetical protein